MERLACTLVELKFDAADAATMTFSGYGAVFGNVDSYGDVIQKGAFADTLAEAKASGVWPAMLSQHGGWGMTAEDMTPVGVWSELSEDGKGLKVSGKLAATARGRELHTLMKMDPRPAIDGLSIGYIPKEWEPRSKPEDPRRRLKRVDLVEISPVTFPANRLARVASVKSLDDMSTLAEIEEYLREAGGFSRGEAKGLIRCIKGVAGQREAGGDELAAALKASLSKSPSILKG